MPFILDEDRAMKTKLQGMTVTNYSDGKIIPVAVYYRFPDTEERTRRFPHIAIDLVDIVFDAARAHRANGPIIPGDLEQTTPMSGYILVGNDDPLPWSLIYQLACYTRQPVHDRQLASQLYMMFPQAYGFLDMTNYDSTVRRADLQSVTRRDTVDSSNKRLYRNIFTVAVSSEFFLDVVQPIREVLTIKETLISTGGVETF